jgi:hypothetical protein
MPWDERAGEFSSRPVFSCMRGAFIPSRMYERHVSRNDSEDAERR